jgi:regulator of sigma E protease
VLGAKVLFYLYNAVYFVIALGVLVFIHELGHFLLAKRLGVGVLTFSLGFGPKLIGRKVGETEYKISAFPLGGYVKMVGEDPGSEIKDEDRARSFSFQPIWKRLCIVVAGPVFNFFLGAVIFSFVNPYAVLPSSAPPPPPVINEIAAGQPAEAAGLKKGDLVLSVAGVNVSTWEELAKTIRHGKGGELVLKVKRNEEVLEIKVTPIAFKEGEEQVYRIGIVGPRSDPTIGPMLELGNGLDRAWMIIRFSVIALVKVIQGEIAARDAVSGPVGIFDMVGQQARKGLIDLLFLVGVLSVSLGFFNLFPIPILDGGHVLFLAIEAVLRRPLSLRKMEIAQQVGLVLIILLMIFALYNDLLRKFGEGLSPK